MIQGHEKDEVSKDEDAKSKVEDLPLEGAEGETVKGGPIYIKYGDIKGDFRPGGG